MFRRCNFFTEYKQYSKSLKKKLFPRVQNGELVENISQKCEEITTQIRNNTRKLFPTVQDGKLAENLSQKYEEITAQICKNRDLALNSKIIQKYKSTISALPSKLTEKCKEYQIKETDKQDAVLTNKNTLLGLELALKVKYKDLKFQFSSPTFSLKKPVARSAVLGGLISTGPTSDAVTISENSIVVENIPEPPAVPDVAAELASQVNILGEPTFASLGLGGYTPVGLVQHAFEYLHVTLGVPWWEAIAIGTLIIRFVMFPLVVIAQRNAARMNNHLPQMQMIQLKMTEARQTGNQLEAARYSQELMLFMKEKQLNPFKNMIVPLAQMPIFISFFMGLREMANVPVDSLRTGGMFWFTDLTVPDQFFALPIITSLTLWATIELGTDSARLSSQNLQTMKYVLRALPLVILPFIVNFPGAILCYWVSSNFISLAQVGFLRLPAVRDYFKIDPLVSHQPGTLPIQNKGFVGGIKESWTNIKITKELEERKRVDEIQFRRAGKGPLVKTYKYDPTKQAAPKTAINAKSR